MKTAYFDCFSGAAGDMIVGALIDAGADKEALSAKLNSIGLSGYTITVESVRKQGFAAVRFNVVLDPAVKQPHRHLRHVREIIEAVNLTESIRRRALATFQRLAEAEARIHGTTIEKVHFHEVGAVDAILDVVGAMFALDLLGIERVLCSSIPTGSGFVNCQHGVLPVPAPATAELLKGVPLAACDETGELTTPTGAAILTSLVEQFGPLPPMTIRSIGYGAGTRDGRTRPNVLRVFTGELSNPSGARTDQIVVLETNLDDASPQLIAHCMDRLLEAGALDVYVVPIQMKKSRAGVLLAVLCEPGGRSDLERIIFTETPTFGIRARTAERSILRRRWEMTATPFGEVRMKVGEGPHGLTVSPEYDDCRLAAEKHGVAVREVMESARQAWRSRGGGHTAL